MLKDVNSFLTQLYSPVPDFASIPAFQEIRSVEEARNRGYWIECSEVFLERVGGSEGDGRFFRSPVN